MLVEVVYVEHAVAVGVVAGVLVCPEGAEGLALHDSLCVGIRRDTADVGVTLVYVVHAVGGVRQLVDGVLVVRQVEGGLPLEVLGLHGHGVDGELDTAVGDVAHVGADPVQGIDAGRDGVAPDEVAGLLVVVLDATVDASAEECEVEADVEHSRALPLQVGVGVVLCLDAVHGVLGAVGQDILERVAVQAVGGDGVVGTEAHGVTAHAVAHAELQLVEHFLVLHKGLLGDVPGCRHGGEGTPAVVLAEHGRAVAADGGLQHIAAVERVVHAAVERDVADGRLRGARHVGDAVDVVGIAQVPEVGHVVVEVVHRHAEAVAVHALLPAVTGHHAQLVQLGDGHVVVAVGLEGLVVALVGVAVCTAVVALVHLRLVGLVPAVGVLVALIRVVGVPVQALDDFQRCLGDVLDALPLVLVVVLVDHRQGVVVGRADVRLIPAAVGIAHGVGGRVVVHGVEHALTGVAAR